MPCCLARSALLQLQQSPCSHPLVYRYPQQPSGGGVRRQVRSTAATCRATASVANRDRPSMADSRSCALILRGRKSPARSDAAILRDDGCRCHRRLHAETLVMCDVYLLKFHGGSSKAYLYRRRCRRRRLDVLLGLSTTVSNDADVQISWSMERGSCPA